MTSRALTVNSLHARAGLLAVYAIVLAFAACTFAMTSAMAQPGDVVASGEFERKKKNTKGAFEIVETEAGLVLRANEEFSTGRGPDIKIFLSPLSAADANGDNATQGAVFLGQLESRRGAFEFPIPADADLATFNSVLVHCEEFSVLFGAGDL